MEIPEFYQGGYYNPQFTPEKRLSDAKNGDHFAVDDLLDFPNDDGCGGGDGSKIFDVNAAGSTDSSYNNVIDNSCNSSFSGSTTDPHFTGNGGDMGGSSSGRNFADGQFSSELCVPYDDLAELEWLSNFVEDSFSSDDLQRLNLYSGMKPAHNEESEYQPEPNRATSNPMFRPETMSVPAKARSKRSRAAPCNWTSRLLMVSPTTPAAAAAAVPPANNNVAAVAAATAMSSSSESEFGKKTVKAAMSKKKECNFDHHNNSSNSSTMVNHQRQNSNSEGRKCLHCATDKTPQWRTGPMGPKTLCNACGVRFKSGRLVPEYRPAASPTFVLTKHSNSHRKVLELRRQKEMMRAQQHHQQFLHHHHQSMMFDVSSNGDDYLIHQHVGPDFRQLI